MSVVVNLVFRAILPFSDINTIVNRLNFTFSPGCKYYFCPSIATVLRILLCKPSRIFELSSRPDLSAKAYPCPLCKPFNPSDPMSPFRCDIVDCRPHFLETSPGLVFCFRFVYFAAAVVCLSSPRLAPCRPPLLPPSALAALRSCRPRNTVHCLKLASRLTGHHQHIKVKLAILAYSPFGKSNHIKIFYHKKSFTRRK